MFLFEILMSLDGGWVALRGVPQFDSFRIMHFKGYPAGTLNFFKKIAKNNNKIWFDKKKSEYQKLVVEPSKDLVRDLNDSRIFKKAQLKSIEKSPLFRLHRDVRFSADKSPYKTHNGLLLSRGGTRKENGVFYFHLEPANCFFAMGFWQPDPKLLTYFRLWTVENHASAKKLLKTLAKKDLSFDSSDSLKRNPRGFEHVIDADIQSLIRMKHWIVMRPLLDKAITSDRLLAAAEKFCTEAAPLLDALRPIQDRFDIAHIARV